MEFGAQEANVKLAKLIKQRPCLFNKTLPEYNRRSLQERAWKDIGKQMGWQASQCKDRWKNLRSVYLRHLKRMSQGVNKKPYYLMNVMSFALPYIKPNSEPYTKILIQRDKSPSPETNEEQQPEEITSPEPGFTKFTPSNATTIQVKLEEESRSSDLSPRNSFSQEQDMGECEVEMPDMTANFDLKSDARKMFLYSLLPDIYAMTDAQMRQFRLKVLNVIEDILDSNTGLANS